MRHRLYRRGELSYGILSVLTRHAFLSDILFRIVSGGEMGVREALLLSPVSEAEREERVRNKMSFLQATSRLKQQGMLIKKGQRFMITAKGRACVETMKKKQTFGRVRPYPKVKGDSLTIIAFDIPEHFRARRALLRAALISLDYRMLQGSVWIGKNKIPNEFLEDMRDSNVIRFVEIFEVKKVGTLPQ